MKIKLSIVFFLGVLTQAFSQDGLSRHLKGIEGCYLDYYSEFADRGASSVTDGEHEVVVSVIYQNSSECYMGKTTVKGGKLVVPVLVQKEDMAYVPLSKLFNDMDMEWLMKQDKTTLYDIHDGMSKLFLSQQGYQV
ncbi:hypothetical protein GCM10009119_15150 [Algoriphagus jejuensis]|uniref:Uncharacterized protein n=1 Tax=Algoriphagus jejuensis TaxID=419934 RepID=A0ABP3YCC6_9BACT